MGGELLKTIENAKRDGVRIAKREAGSQDAGEIRNAEGEKYIAFQSKQRPEPEYVRIHDQQRYDDEMKKRFQDLLTEKGRIRSTCMHGNLQKKKGDKLKEEVNTELPAANFFEPVEVKS